MVAIGCVCWLSGAARGVPAPPDHIVIVIEENHSFQNVIGNVDAPYMNQLATQGALLTNMYALTHPSQPNYLQFFSGSNQGVGSNGLPLAGFTTPNLGAALFAAGRTFTGYCEDLPAVGSNIEVSGQYYRKHNPWANWQMDPPGPNQYASTVNRPFTDFPSDYTTLPTVSIVVPNQDHDMHDGTIAQADVWLSANLGGYAAWCRTHNSLLIVTWDEDSFAAQNQIPTIFYGPGVRLGTHDSRRTLHDLLATVCAMYGATPPGAGADVRPMVGLFAGEPVVSVARFRQGEVAYLGAHDTWIDGDNGASTHGADVQLVCDGTPVNQALLRFDNLFGASAGRVPPGATIHSAKLSLLTGTGASDLSGSTMDMHRMLVPFSEASTWESLVGGVNVGSEAVSPRDFSTQPRTLDTWEVMDVTASVLAWQAGASNNGWVVNAVGGDGWRFASCEAASVNQRPILEIAYSMPGCAACAADFDCSGGGPMVADVFAFLSAWFAGDPRANFNGTGGINVQDIFDFLAAWFVGC